MIFTVYSKDACIHCVRAVQMLKARNLPFQEFKLDKDYTRDHLVENIIPAGQPRTVPQIFHGDRYVGGADALSLYLEEATGGADAP